MFASIVWDISPEITTIDLGFTVLSLRWYGLMFLFAFSIGYKIMESFFKKESVSVELLDSLTITMVLSTLIGARLGHCLFYDPGYYLSHPIEILWVHKGGLASHGAAIAILAALYWFSRNKLKKSYLWLLDRITITIALAGMFIRLGNLFNSEIVGLPTELPWAFVFPAVDMLPRHPTQLYEACMYLLTFIITYSMYGKKLPEGRIFGVFLIGVFGSRFVIEFLKENQSAFEGGLPLNMGQILSIPLIVVGIYLLARPRQASK